MRIKWNITCPLKDFEGKIEPISFIEALGYGPKVKVQSRPFDTEGHGSVWITCFEPEARSIYNTLETHGIAASVVKSCRYSSREINEADLLDLSLNAMPCGSFSTRPQLDEKISETCPICLSGGLLRGPLTVELDKSASSTGFDQLHDSRHLVSPAVRDALTAAGANRNDFVEANCFDEVVPVSSEVRYLFQPTMILPKLSMATRGLVRAETSRDGPCPRCDRDGYFHTPSAPYLPAVERSKVCDLLSKHTNIALFVRTWECLGIGNRPVRAESIPPLAGTVCNQRARQELSAVSTAAFRWIPLTLL